MTKLHISASETTTKLEIIVQGKPGRLLDLAQTLEGLAQAVRGAGLAGAESVELDADVFGEWSAQ